MYSKNKNYKPPTPASAVEEAARLYPYPKILTVADWRVDEVIDRERSAHIRCAGMYTDTIDNLKALLKEAVGPCECEECQKIWNEYKAKHNL